jgi:hypothetical protein
MTKLMAAFHRLANVPEKKVVTYVRAKLQKLSVFKSYILSPLRIKNLMEKNMNERTKLR